MCQLTLPRPQFMLLTCHTPGYGPERLHELLADAFATATPAPLTLASLCSARTPDAPCPTARWPAGLRRRDGYGAIFGVRQLAAAFQRRLYCTRLDIIEARRGLPPLMKAVASHRTPKCRCMSLIWCGCATCTGPRYRIPLHLWVKSVRNDVSPSPPVWLLFHLTHRPCSRPFTVCFQIRAIYLAIWLWVLPPGSPPIGLKLIAPRWDDITRDGDFAYLPPTLTSVRGKELMDKAFPELTAQSNIVFVVALPGGRPTADDTAVAEKLAAQFTPKKGESRP